MGLYERRSLFPSTPSSPHHRSLIFAWLVFATFLAIIPEPGTGYRERGGYNTRLISVQSRACQAYSRLKTRIDQLEIDRSSEFSYHFHARGQITSDRKSKLSMIRLLFMHSIHCCQTCVPRMRRSNLEIQDCVLMSKVSAKFQDYFCRFVLAYNLMFDSLK